jgi:hypothetical protein
VEKADAKRPDKTILTVIFSFNRAMQLDALLNSLLYCCRDPGMLDVNVIYKTTGGQHEQNYALLEHTRGSEKNITFLRETSFKDDLLGIIPSTPKIRLRPFKQSDPRYILFLVDDCLFVEHFSIADMLRALKTSPKSLGFSLRLGRNTTRYYVKDRPQQLPDFSAHNSDVVKFNWVNANAYFGYPLEISSSLYSLDDVSPLLRGLDYRNPNELEAGLASKARKLFSGKKPDLLCYNRSIAFCSPVNMVQTVFDGNRVGRDVNLSVENLADLYAKGYRVDIERLFGFVPDSAHQEVDLPFVKVS